VFPVPADTPGPVESAAEYAETLARVFAPLADGAAPVLDLILLGMGDDGHCASLFPGMPSLAVDDAWVVSSPPGTLPPPVDRVTFTFPVLNAARRVVFLVAGGKKAPPCGTSSGAGRPPRGALRRASARRTARCCGCWTRRRRAG
jgi:6-phosphogluconolactonase